MTISVNIRWSGKVDHGIDALFRYIDAAEDDGKDSGLKWVPESERAPRSPWTSLRKVPFGWCQLCGEPIIVGAKGDCHSLAEMAAGCKHVKQRHWHAKCSKFFDQCVPKRWADGRYFSGGKCAACGRDFRGVNQRVRAMEARALSAKSWRRSERLQRVAKKMGLVEIRGFYRYKVRYDCDHTVPLWAGGRNHPSNFQLLCHRCHTAKTKRETRLRAAAKAEWIRQNPTP